MTKFLVTLYIILILAVLGLSIAYPQDFAMALGFFVVGSLLGVVVAYNLFTEIHDRGFERSQKLSEKQVGSPAAIWREARLTHKEAAKEAEIINRPQPIAPQETVIPQFTITGLKEN